MKVTGTVPVLVVVLPALVLVVELADPQVPVGGVSPVAPHVAGVVPDRRANAVKADAYDLMSNLALVFSSYHNTPTKLNRRRRSAHPSF